MESPIIYPMAAKPQPDEDKLALLWDNEDWVAERKFDGCRYLCYIPGDGGPNRFFSRRESAKDGMPVEKTDNVPHLRDCKFPFKGLTILDGEILTPATETSSEVVKIMGASPEKAVARQQECGYVQYMLFDILYFDGEDVTQLPWYARRTLLEGIFEQMNWGTVASPFCLTSLYAGKDKEAFYHEIVRQGGEGIILKNIYATYQPDKRPADTWVKVKKYQTFDVVVMGYEPPEMDYKGKADLADWPYWAVEQDGKWCPVDQTKTVILDSAHAKPVTKFWYQGWIGAVKFGQYSYKDTTAACSEGCTDYPEECECCGGISCDLIEIGQTSGMDDETRAAISENPEAYMGKVFECGAMERIKKTNALRHPRYLGWRDDKRPEDCIIGEC